ncbi:MAG TPA: hypothetical protein PKA37_08570, partial [Planctomycetota bacterium]|nr:hypothetical protein [Planctomycetota bacterium]
MSVRPATLGIALFLALGVPGLIAQNEGDTPNIRDAGADIREIVFPPDGLTLEQALAWARESTGRSFQYKDADIKAKGKILMTGISRVPKDRMYEFWQAVFVTQGFAMVPNGSGDFEFFVSVEPIDTSRSLKQRAIYVPIEDLPKWKDKVGEVIMTTINLQHVQVGNVRGAVQTIMSNRTAEFAQEVASANSLIVVGFCPTVYALNQILKAMDVPTTVTTLKFEKLALQYAVAEELQPIIQDL